jgi:hypothetical protein
MFEEYDFFDLCYAMRARKFVRLQRRSDGKIFVGLLNALQLESGCGKSWNVTLHLCHSESVTFCICTK